MSQSYAAPDRRSGALRVLQWVGLVPLVLLTAGCLLGGAVGAAEPRGRALLLVGLALVVVVVTVVGVLGAHGAHARRPPEPRLVELDGEAALLLPRDARATDVVSRGYLGLAAVLGLGAVLAALGSAWVAAGVLLLASVGLLRLAAPGRRDLAGGLWFTPTRVVGEHLGLRWELPWGSVTGAVARDPMPVLFRESEPPSTRRTAPRGRAWNPLRQPGVVAVDTTFLAGGSLVASYVVTRSLAEPSSRAVLGTPASLPPPPSVPPGI